MSQYQSNSVCFNFPETWEVVDDDGDNFIRAITIEDPNDGFYSMDIYNLSIRIPS
jgi:ubiquitin-protein ligase